MGLYRSVGASRVLGLVPELGNLNACPSGLRGLRQAESLGCFNSGQHVVCAMHVGKLFRPSLQVFDSRPLDVDIVAPKNLP